MKKAFPVILFIIFSFFLNAQVSEKDSLHTILKLQKDTTALNTLLQLGKVYNKAGLRDSGLYYYTNGLDIALKHGTQKQVAVFLLVSGETKSKLSRYDEALTDLFSILKMAGEIDSTNLISKAKKEIGAIYIYQKKEKEALPYLLEAEKELQRLKDTVGLFTVYSNLPVCIALLGDTVKAMEYFKKGFKLLDEYGKNRMTTSAKANSMRFRMAYNYNMINFMTKKEDLQVQLEKMQEWQKEVLAGDNKFQQFIMYCHLADISLRLQQYENAQSYGEQALKFKEFEDNYTYLADVSWVVAVASAALNQYEKAYNNLQIHRQNNDSIFKSSQTEAVNTVEKKYQVEKKEQEIISLNKEKKTQKTIVALAIGSLAFVLVILVLIIRSKKLQKKYFHKEQEIKQKEIEQKMAVLEQTALRAQMNPHFIFNSLNSVQRYVINHDIEGVNHYLSTFANLIRQTLENSGKQLISLKEELLYLETYIKLEQMRSNGKFDYNISIDTAIDPEATFIPNMIIQPFVENSILHGTINPAKGKALINLSILKKAKLTCIVEDNGEGINKQFILNAQLENAHEPMGSNITEKRIAMYNTLHDEKIELQIIDKSSTDKNEPGTMIILKFPLNN